MPVDNIMWFTPKMHQNAHFVLCIVCVVTLSTITTKAGCLSCAKKYLNHNMSNIYYEAEMWENDEKQLKVGEKHW